MTWPKYIQNAFDSVPFNSTQESDYYGPYNVLLGYLFPPSEGYIVDPQHKEPNRKEEVDMTIVYLVEKCKHVVFFVEIKPSGHYNRLSDRALADAQIRQRYKKVFESAAPVLHGASALGTKLCFYEFDSQTRRVRPPSVPDDSDLIVDIAPQSRWAHDLFRDDGEIMLRSIASKVRDLSEKLQS